ncbi:acyltransferase [Gordonia sp. CPCC 205515]|uniref:acyltransferase family protein n=1 Tax=Gordonia sp. CPCC 205515 TaxID=3140791 RepID=UPI003AF3CE66
MHSLTSRTIPTTERRRGVSAAELDALSEGRDRVIDLLRIVSLIVVVAGHSIMLTVAIDDLHSASGIRLGNMLGDVPALQPVTWLLQILPLFFFAGAAAATLGWRSGADGHTPGQWLFARSQRLLRPVAWYLLVGVVALAVLAYTGQGAAADVVARLSVQLLWFLGAYLLVLAVVPFLQRISTAREVVVALAACWGATAVIDALRLTIGPAALGNINFLTVWSIPAGLGIAYAKRLLTTRAAALMAVAAFVVNVLLVAVGPYEMSLVTVPGQHLSNMSPPSLLLAGHAIVLCGLAIALRRALAAIVERPRVWWWVAMGNRGAMTLYLWHLPVLALIIVGGHAIGVDRSPQSAGYPLVIVIETALLLAAMVPVVLALSPLENRPIPWWDAPVARHTQRARDFLVLTLLVVVAISTLMVARHGLVGDGRWWLLLAMAAALGARTVVAQFGQTSPPIRRSSLP